MTHRHACFAAVVVVALTSSFPVEAQSKNEIYEAEQQRASLSGVGAGLNPCVGQVLTHTNKAAADIGFSFDSFFSSVRSQMESRGVPITNNVLGAPPLEINVRVFKFRGIWAYNVTVYFHQASTVWVNEKFTMSPTWRKTATGFATTQSGVSLTIQNEVEKFVDAFSEDYLAVNPQGNRPYSCKTM
jgi:hypothetical protein